MERQRNANTNVYIAKKCGAKNFWSCLNSIFEELSFSNLEFEIEYHKTGRETQFQKLIEKAAREELANYSEVGCSNFEMQKLFPHAKTFKT